MNNTKLINLFVCIPSRFLLSYMIDKFKLYDLLIFTSIGFIYRYITNSERAFNKRCAKEHMYLEI